VAGQVGEQLEKGGEQDLVESVLGGLSLVEGQLGEPLDQVLQPLDAGFVLFGEQLLAAQEQLFPTALDGGGKGAGGEEVWVSHGFLA
jgi:hypothetical protein